MTTDQESPRVASASREIAADAGAIFELIADPAQQPRWDGNDNLASAAAGQRVRRAGDVFTMQITPGDRREPGGGGAEAPRAPGALGTRAARRVSYAGHPHLRLDRADGREPLPARP